MITTAELHRVADRAGLRFDQAEKDYEALLKAIKQGKVPVETGV